MKKSRVICISIIFILFLITTLLSDKVEAKSINPPMYFGIAELRQTTQMGYAMGDPATGAERIWKIVQYSDTNYDDPTEVSAYCIKADQGFSNETLTDIYDVSYNMKTEKQDIAKQNNILQDLINGGQYDNLLALADLLYVKDVSTETEREHLLEISGANDVVEKSDFSGKKEYYITDDEIDAVQQAAIWYFTNYQQGGEYDHYNKDTWIWYTSVDDKGVYNNLSAYDPTGMIWTDAKAGYFRERQMIKLYKYLIDTAKSNAEKGVNDEKTILTVYASNQNPEAQPIMEVVKLPRQFDLSLRKYITEVNDEPVTNSRIPVVDESTLETGTTATYKHRKDPVEVKTDDTITYNMTIYNEGEKAGRATKIVDQLPTGLEFVEVVSGNFEIENYNKETNTVYLTRKSNNKTNLPAYVEGNLSSETIQIKCKVTATGEQSDKILTNIAWISEEIDEDGNVITSKPGDDRDSEPSTMTTKNKDQLVTTDNGYIGNSNNSGKNLNDSNSYFEGQQDDDDFEKVIVRAVTSVEVSKVWEDNSNQDGIRATEIKVELLKNEQATGQFITLNEGNKWSGKFDNLPTKENGQDITYSVKEITTINGYTTNTNATTDSTGKSYTITNSHTPETTSVSVNKVWDDNNNQDGIRAPEIEVALKKGTQTLQTVKLNASNDWKHIFTGLAKYENGQEIEYTVEEVSVPEGYTENTEETTNNNFTITNTHETELMSITAKKEWYDFNDRDGLRPDSVKFELYKNGQATGTTKTLTAPTWTATFDNLPVKENGKDIVYTVIEVNVPEGYEPIGGSIPEEYSLEEQGIQTQEAICSEGTKENGYTITNIYYPFDLSLRKYITKVGDTDITDRIPNIDINPLIEGYMGNGEETTAHYKHKKNPVTVQTGDKVIYNLTVYNEGLKYGMATKIEDQLPTGLKFERVISDDYEVESYSETDNLLKLKLMDTNTNQAEPNFGDYLLEPFNGGTLDSVTIQIECTVTAEAGSENQILTNVAWISEAYDVIDGVTITTQEHADTDSEPGTKPNVNKDDLVSTDDGYIGNENNNGKDLSNSEEYFTGEQDDDDFEKIVIEAKTEITVTKQWNDNNNQDGKRPTSVEVELYKNGTATGETKTLSGNAWTATFTNLPVYENGEKITYTVKEVNVPDGYTASGDGTEENGYTITNTHTPGLTSVSVNKVWNDNNNQDGIRPGEIVVELLKNEQKTGNTVTLNAENNWADTFDNLPAYEDGEKIIYAIEEITVDGYNVQITTNGENNFTITNTHTPEVTEITAKKQWNDNNDQDGIRPESVEFELYKNNEATGNKKTLTGDAWTVTFENLPVYENGQKITYTVKEVSEPEGYTASGDGTEENGYTITNTHTPGLTSVSVNKVWNDNNNQDGIRPEEIQVQLVKEVGGERTELEDKIITLSESNEWKGTFDNLPVYENGQKITYSVKEITISGYAVNITQNSENNFTITNTHTPGTTSVTVNKVWDDKDDQDGLRPDSIQVQLIGTIEDDDGTTVTVVDKNITITADDGWIGTFNDLPVNEDGKEIIYTVREITQIDGYTTEITENTETASNENDTQSVANVEEPEITTQTYAAKDMVRAAVATVEPKNFTITNTHIVEEAFDLSLRKFIVAVSEDETIEESDILRNEDGTGYAREPVVDASKLNTTDENGNTITTAIYNHTKEPVLVKKNDIVVYMLRVYNEGEQDGYAAEIKDHLPSYLTFVDGEFNKQYGWEVSADGRTVTTRYLENSVIAKPQTNASGNNTLSYVQVPIMCRVSDSANANENITNIADITEYQDKDKQPVEDRDSKEENVELPTDEELPGYKDEESENSYVPGQEDDDDFEKVYVQDFDLALRKFISEVDGTSYNRSPNVDLSGLESGTTAIYNHTKDPVLVKRNSVVIYTIRVYNEGDISGYAEEITDYLPEGLEFLPEHEINIQYEWQVSEDGRVVTTDYLSSAKETTDRQNEIQAFDGQTLDYKEVQIACQVKDNVESNVKLTNLAEITEDSDEDRDSTPDNVEIPGDEELPGYKDDEIDKDYVPGQEDDDDFEKVIVQDFDLALRKFITKVDEEDVTTRIPEVSYNRDKDQITYNHTKEPVEVITGNVVEYTIRVYNEGDMAGYAEEVADDIPDGLKYLPENATNTEYRWVMYDEEGNVTENSEEAVEIRTDYLSKEQEETEGENLLQAFNPEEEIGEENPDYRDIKVAFEVVEPNESDRIIVNSAQITEDSDENGNPVEDVDSIPDEWNEGEDDQDREYIKLTYFDLALRKWVTQAIVIENGKETITQTGHTAEMDPEPVVKVELYRKNVNDVTVKFRYSIRITNEGDIAGYAKEITDYVPEGLRFVAEDNPEWTDEGNNIISTRLLENTLLQPGESAEAEVVLTWINGEDNMGQMTNIAEISEDYNDKGAPDRDSTPDNQKSGEDDIDDAPVLLSIETGQERIYYVLGFTVLGTLAGGLILIKKFVI